MGEDAGKRMGVISWTDLTVKNAGELRDFYGKVAGWSSSPVSMGEYEDYSMVAAGGDTVAGICHARGSNANLPPQWLIYITVADVDESAKKCTEMGGKVIEGPRAMGGGRFCVIRDPAGAVAALFSG